MTMKNIGASVRERINNKAKADNVNTQFLLTRYALERMLYRLSVSEHRDSFLLKGALLFDLWYDVPLRPTRDIDLLGFHTCLKCLRTYAPLKLKTASTLTQ